MVTLLLLLYFVCAFAAFKLFKIRVTPVSVAIPVVLGVFVIGGIVIGWKMAAPMSGKIFVKRDVIQLVGKQYSKQRISKIHFKEGELVKKGEPLFEVDPTPNEYAVEQVSAQLAVAKEQIAEQEAAIEVAIASTEAAKATEALAKVDYDAILATIERNVGAIAKLTVIQAEKAYESSRAGVDQAIAAETKARFSLTSAKEAMKEVDADLATAKLNLKQCVIRAPADGYVINWQAVVGTMVHPVNTLPTGNFMDMSETVVGAVFPQNLLNHVEAGDSVEIAFKSLPGEITTGKVQRVLEYTGEGQLAPGLAVPVAANIRSKGYLVVRIVLDDQELAKELPLGGAGDVAIYTTSGKPFHPISKIMIRLKKWMNYTPF
jgi:multidrug resistance efflux pump